jgi:hypothetical protein
MGAADRGSAGTAGCDLGGARREASFGQPPVAGLDGNAATLIVSKMGVWRRRGAAGGVGPANGDLPATGADSSGALRWVVVLIVLGAPAIRVGQRRSGSFLVAHHTPAAGALAIGVGHRRSRASS